MSLPKLGVGVIAVALAAAGCGPGQQEKTKAAAPLAPAPAAPVSAAAPALSGDAGGKITARAELARVLAQAHKWQADAQLFSAFTSYAEGAATAFWLYDFQSPATRTCLRLRVMASGALETTEASHDCRVREPVPTEFVDSPAALASAVSAGMKTGESIEFNLRFLKDKALSAPRSCWVLSSDFDEEEGVTRAWCVDPATGAFVVRLSGYGGPVFKPN